MRKLVCKYVLQCCHGCRVVVVAAPGSDDRAGSHHANRHDHSVAEAGLCTCKLLWSHNQVKAMPLPCIGSKEVSGVRWWLWGMSQREQLMLQVGPGQATGCSQQAVLRRTAAASSIKLSASGPAHQHVLAKALCLGLLLQRRHNRLHRFLDCSAIERLVQRILRSPL